MCQFTYKCRMCGETFTDSTVSNDMEATAKGGLMGQKLIEWKRVDGFPYSVSSDGQVRNDRTLRILKPWLNKQGYYAVRLFDKMEKRFTIHRLVASAFIPNKENKPQVNHIDGKRTNNHVDNLEWATNQENHSIDFGCLGTRHPKNKAHMVRVRCKETGKEYKSIKEAAAHCKISGKNISACVRGASKSAGGFQWERI